jgi:hypothetical protein
LTSHSEFDNQKNYSAMKSIVRLLAILFLATTAAQAQKAPADVINETRSRYKLEFDQVTAMEAAALVPVVARFAKELTNLKSAAQTKGDLKAVIEIDALIAAANTGSPAEQPTAASPALRTAYANYQNGKAAALRPFAGKRRQLEEEYARALTTLEQQYTRSGEIEAAKLARDAKAASPNTETETIASMSGAVLQGDAIARSEKSYKAPIQVEWRFETDGEVRFAYACEQLIFNWVISQSELRIDGGPVSGQHKKGQGTIVKNKPVAVKLDSVRGRSRTRPLDGRFFWR